MHSDHAPGAEQAERQPLAPVTARLVLVLLLVLNLSFVAAFGRNVPYQDDWLQVPPLVGAEPLSSHWLFRQHVGHRIVLPKLIILPILRVLGHELRYVMVLNVLLLGLAAHSLIRAAEAARGRASHADVVFPLACLSLAHLPNALWAFQLCYVLPTVLACMTLAIMVRSANGLSLGDSVAAGGLLAGQTLCFSSGAILAVTSALWLIACGLAAWKAGARARAATALSIGIANLLLVVILVYQVKIRSDHAPPYDRPDLIVLTSLQALSLACGPGAIPLWHWSGWALLLGVAAAGSHLAVRWWRGEQRLRQFGLLMMLAGLLLTVLAIGCSRARLGDVGGLASRYATLLLPLLALLPFALLSVRSEGTRKSLACAVVVVMLGLCVMNLRFGFSYARTHHDLLARFEVDVAEGRALTVLAARHAGALHNSEGKILDGLQALRARGIMPYAQLPLENQSSQRLLPLSPSAVHDLHWQANRAVPTGQSPQVTFRFARQRLTAIRIKGTCVSTNGRGVPLTFNWRANDCPFQSLPKRLRSNGKEWLVTVPIDADVYELMIQLGGEIQHLELSEVALLASPD
jgi:hypothetical protein